MYLHCVVSRFKVCTALHRLSTRHASSHHTTLGVPLTASKKDIKSAFVCKVKLCHPDIFPDDKSKHQQFLKLHEAYENLSQQPHIILNYKEFDRVAVNEMSLSSSRVRTEEYYTTMASRRAECDRQRRDDYNVILNLTILLVMTGAVVVVGLNYLIVEVVRKETQKEKKERVEYERSEEGLIGEDYFQAKARSAWFPLFL